MALTEEQIFSRIQEVLVDALGVDEEDVTPDAKLVDDLGAESIDFLDISFRLEKAFEIKIEASEIFPQDVLENPEYVEEGKVTDAGMEELKKHLPHADLTEFEASRQVEDFSSVFTVNTLVKFIASRLG